MTETSFSFVELSKEVALALSVVILVELVPGLILCILAIASISSWLVGEFAQ